MTTIRFSQPATASEMTDSEVAPLDMIRSTDSSNTGTSIVHEKGREETATTGPINIATISAGFEKGDYLVREEKGQRIYFDFFEEAFNFVANKGYVRMEKDNEREWFDIMNTVHTSIKGGPKFNTGKLLMVFSKPVDITKIVENNNPPGSSSKSISSTKFLSDSSKPESNIV